MARGSRGSFGFSNVNGRAIKLTVTERVSNQVMTKRAPIRMQKKVIAAMNRAGKAAERRAKNPDWTPKRTGRLIASIRWRKARLTLKSNISRGVLTAGGTDVPYARIQEFTNPRKPFFLLRAVRDIAQPMLLAELRKKRIYEEALIGTGFRGIQFGR